MRLIVEMTTRLNSLVTEFARAVSILVFEKIPLSHISLYIVVWIVWMLFLMQNFSEVAADFREIFSEEESPSLTQEHLNDPEFIRLWFKVKLLPLLPNVSTDLLSCLSTKNFSCRVYQTMWVRLFSEYTVLIWFHAALRFSFFSAVFYACVVWKTLATRWVLWMAIQSTTFTSTSTSSIPSYSVVTSPVSKLLWQFLGRLSNDWVLFTWLGECLVLFYNLCIMFPFLIL